MKKFNDYYTLYTNGNENLYDEINIDLIKKLEDECDKDLSKYYDFGCWLRAMEEYYK